MKGRAIQLEDSNNTASVVALKFDVKRDFNNKIIQGLVVGDTLNQNQALILVANPGEFPFAPTLGCAIDELILNNDYLRMRHRIREHFAKDGLKVNKLELSQSEPLNIEAVYE